MCINAFELKTEVKSTRTLDEADLTCSDNSDDIVAACCPSGGEDSCSNAADYLRADFAISKISPIFNT